MRPVPRRQWTSNSERAAGAEIVGGAHGGGVTAGQEVAGVHVDAVDELLFQNGAPAPPLNPVVDWNFVGTPTKVAPGELTASAMAATGIKIAAAKIPNVFNIFMVPPMGSLPPAAFETVWQLFRLTDVFVPS